MWMIIVMIVSMIIQMLLRPKTQQPTVTPGEVSAATVDASSPVPVLFGTRRFDTANVAWYGDVGATPIVSCQGKK